MDIYITERDTGSCIALSMMPEKTKKKSSTKYLSYDIINKGEVKVQKGTNLLTFSWSGIFPGAGRKNASYVKTQHWQAPEDLERILDNWRTAGTVLILMVTETSINHHVTLTEFVASAQGGNGDVYYDISFTEVRELVVQTAPELGIKAPAKVESVRPEPPVSETYTIVSGDTLWAIAKRYLGSGTRYPEIYSANSSVIEGEAKRRGRSNSDNGHWIYPGTVLTIPM